MLPFSNYSSFLRCFCIRDLRWNMKLLVFVNIKISKSYLLWNAQEWKNTSGYLRRDRWLPTTAEMKTSTTKGKRRTKETKIIEGTLGCRSKIDAFSSRKEEGKKVLSYIWRDCRHGGAHISKLQAIRYPILSCQAKYDQRGPIMRNGTGQLEFPVLQAVHKSFVLYIIFPQAWAWNLDMRFGPAFGLEFGSGQTNDTAKPSSKQKIKRTMLESKLGLYCLELARSLIWSRLACQFKLISNLINSQLFCLILV